MRLSIVIVLAALFVLCSLEVEARRVRNATKSPTPIRTRLRLKKPDLESSATDVVVQKTVNKHDKIVCYYTNWSQYRPKIGKFLPEDIPADLCTHLIFAFGWMKKGKLSSFETNDETKDGKVGLYDRINVLKKTNPELKTLLAIGGWSFGTQKFKEMASNYYSRRIFIFSAIPYLRDRNFDGLDIDWEYPKGSEEKVNYALFLKELKTAFEEEAKDSKKPRLLLTAAVPVGPDSIRGGYDVPSVSSSLDFINLMAYDFHGKWESQTGHNAPLFAPSSDSAWRKQLSVSAAAELWMKLGAPREKLVIGMPTYGRSFTLSDKFNSSVNVATKGGGTAGVYTREGGFLAYYEICELLRSGKASYVWDDEMKVPYLVSEDQWVGFDDEKAIRNKMKWIQENKFAGAMVWTVDMDDFTGSVCGGGKYPLIQAMREELLNLPRHKDIDWSKIAGTAPAATAASPPVEGKKKKKVVPVVVKEEVEEDDADDEEEEEQELNTRPATLLCYVKTLENVDPNLCTHIVLAFGRVKDNQLHDEESYKTLVALKEKNSALKVLISLDSSAIGHITESHYKTGQFIYNSMEFLREANIDGLDIYYPEPKSDITELIRELRLAFEGEAKGSKAARLLVTLTVPGSVPDIYNPAELAKSVDYFNVITYTLGPSSNVQHSSPLFPIDPKDESVSSKVTTWAGVVPKEKILLGVTTVARSFKLDDVDKFDIGAKAKGQGAAMGYKEVCKFLDNANTTLVWDNEQMVPFAYRGTEWVGFDDERSLKTKIDWLRTEKLAGVMVWTLDSDDAPGKACSSGKYPLTTAIKAELKDYKVKGLPEESVAEKKKKNANEVECAEEDGHISYHKDVNDCTKYYMCEGERKHHMPCPAKLVFNVNENVCDWPENVEGCGGTPKE